VTAESISTTRTNEGESEGIKTMPIMTINFLEFASGQQLPVLPSLTVPFTPGAGLGSITAPPNVSVPDPTKPNGPGIPWSFGFWNINGSLAKTPTAPLPEPGTDFTASAWYFGGGPGLHQDLVSAWAFSLSQNKLLSGDTPIGTVNPPGAQIDANHVSTHDSPVQIVALDSIGGAGAFVSWLPLGGTASGATFTAAQHDDDNPIGFYRIRVPRPITQHYDPLDTVTVYVRDFDGNLWLEHAGANGKFGQIHPPREPVDGNVSFFSAVDATNIYVLGSDGKLWLEHAGANGKFGEVPPPREPVRANVASFSVVDVDEVYVLGSDGNLWLEHGPFGTVPPKREPVDTNVTDFTALDAATVYVRVQDPPTVPPSLIKQFSLFLDTGPFKTPPTRGPQVDDNVQSASPLDAATVYVQGEDSNLWLEHGPFGTVPPHREPVDASVFSCVAMDAVTAYVLDSVGNLWLEHAGPNGKFGQIHPPRELVDTNLLPPA
jgi:hypothetical protein